jgi:DNA-binding transcriptional LysR family regulator
MDRHQALRTFVAVADRRSFSDAARSLHISATAASRAVADLEKQLGAVLLRRTTRSVGLTPEGAAFLERCRAALNELEDAARSLRGENAEPRGLLIVTAPLEFGRMHILPVLVSLLRVHRQLEVRLTLTDRVVRLVEEGLDVAVRIAELSDTALHAVRLGQVRRVLVASPAYLAARGMPTDLAQLREHELIATDAFAIGSEWRFAKSRRLSLRHAPRLSTDNVLAAIDAAVDGLGIARPLSYQVEEHVRAGRLRYLLAEFDPPPVPVNLVFQASRRGSPNVRAFIAAAQEYFRAHPIGQSAEAPPARATALPAKEKSAR